MKMVETERNGKTQKNWKKKSPKTGRNWMILKETGRTGRNRKKQEDTGRNRKKH